MSDGAISQDEIDALLAGVGMDGLGGGGSSSAQTTVLSDSETKALQDFYNGILSNLQSNLSTLTGDAAEFSLGAIEGVNREKMLQKIPEMAVTVVADYNSGLTGDHSFIISPEFAQKLASLINKEENIEIDDMSLSVISECFSQHTGAEITALSEKPDLSTLASDPPDGTHCPKAMVRFPTGDFVVVNYNVTLGGNTILYGKFFHLLLQRVWLLLWVQLVLLHLNL